MPKIAQSARIVAQSETATDGNGIDKTMVMGFREWIERRNGKGCRASSAYLEKLRTIHNRARDLYNDDDVAEALNHARRGADRVTGIYVERDFTKAWEANRKVLDLLK